MQVIKTPVIILITVAACALIGQAGQAAATPTLYARDIPAESATALIDQSTTCRSLSRVRRLRVVKHS
ncbi:hypothetical protein IE81DRAFT_346049 [Ceraceosorus guamensis]|uniref:Uncharacterized protein n=1 Tax=Ceraceosorus guamensis TaxID=1522189 RepID=A0A316W3L7_9BASI|nr:hypothetical protein IE81DRAFT_346049 [Ceraceosorus guamensis]PWN44114.1 hypothetical protein IE81DRAFT_346049 [Ceraceosorus guamensis]